VPDADRDVGAQLLGEAMKEATWLRHLGEAGRVSIWVIAKRVPVVIGQIARLGWRASPRALATVVVCTVFSAVLAGLALVESVHVLGVLFGQGTSAARIRSALPSVVVLVVLYSVRACSDTAINYGQAQLAPRIKRNAEIELYGLMARVKADAFADADLADDLQRAADNGIGYLQQSVPGCIAVVSSILSIVSSAGVLAYLHP
jgi:ATP-binding cassette subfamily B protein/ATP-binding cassette subfamily C protein